MNNWLLYLVIEALRPRVTGQRIKRCRQLHPLLTIELSSPHSYVTTVLSNPGPFLFHSSKDWLEGCPAKPAFGQLTDCSIESIDQLDGDRIASFDLISPGGGRMQLCFTLFGASVKSELKTVDPSDARPNHHANTKPTVRNVPFGLITREDARTILAGDNPLHREIPGVEPEMLKTFTDEDGIIDVDRLLDFRDRINSGLSPIHMFLPENLLRRAIPVPEAVTLPDTARRNMGPFDNVVEAADAIGCCLVQELFPNVVERRLSGLRARLKSQRTLLDKLLKDKEAAARHEAVRREAEILAAFQSQIKKGAKHVTLSDPYQTGVTVELTLDPTLSIPEQVQKRFKKAIKLEKSMQFIIKRMDHLAKEIKTLEGIINEILNIKYPAEALTRISEVKKTLKLPTDGRRQSRQDGEHRYRKFDLDETWFVLVGRNNKENDELTFHVAAPSDLWFHAQSVAGSHVILKSTGSKAPPSGAILVAAAEIAAYFSKARHSSLVPVIYTRRKYVRKPRKAKPGQVTCENEKTIFAEPKRPNVSGDGDE